MFPMLETLVVELTEDARHTKFELNGWDHKREYRRLRDIAKDALKEAKQVAQRSRALPTST